MQFHEKIFWFIWFHKFFAWTFLNFLLHYELYSGLKYDFSLWGKQCIVLSKWTFFRVIVQRLKSQSFLKLYVREFYAFWIFKLNYLFPEIPKATFSWIPFSMKPFKLLNLTKDSILKYFLCMCFLWLVYFWCFFLFTRLLEVLRGRRTWLYPNLWKPGPLMTTWIMNGSLDQVI